MRFLLRAAFWLGIVLLLLPTDGLTTGSSTAASDDRQASTFGAADAAAAASAMFVDMGEFCTRQPEACAVGAQAAIAVGHKAQAGAKMLYEFLSEALDSAESGAAAHKPTAKRSEIVVPGKGLDTLTQIDLAPHWRGPAPGDDTRGRAPDGA